MPSSVILSDNGVTSGTQGIKSTGGDDGALVLQTTTSGGTPTTALTISNTQTATFASTATATKLIPTGNVTAGNGMYLPAANTVAIGTNGTAAITVDSSQNVGIGTSSPSYKLNVSGGGETISTIGGTATGNTYLAFRGNTGTRVSYIGPASSGADSDLFIVNEANSPIYLYTNNTERARITSGGYFKASNNGTYAESSISHEFRTTEDARSIIVTATNDSYTSDALQIRASRNTTNNSFYALAYYNDGATAYKFRVADSGNVTNTNNSYGSISDIKTKQDIVDAASQWDDLKNLRVRKFRYKNDPTGPLQIGLVAQEAETVSPGLVEEHPDYEEITKTREVERVREVTPAVLDEDGNEVEPAVTETYTEEEEYTERVPTGTTTKAVKYSVLYMKAIKALQEAMERIEILEAKVAALEQE